MFGHLLVDLIAWQPQSFALGIMLMIMIGQLSKHIVKNRELNNILYYIYIYI